MRRILALVVVVPWLVWALVRTLGIELPYPGVALLAFTPYAALTVVVPVLLALVLRQWRIAVLAGVAAVGLAVAVVPRTVGGPQGDATGPRVVVMTSNVWLGSANMRAVLRIARQHDVDVLSLQEVRPKTVARLEAAGVEEQFPGRIVEPELGAGGSALLTRLPMRPLRVPVRPGAAQPEALISVAGAPLVRIKAVHPRPPVSRVAAPQWRAALEAMPGSDSRGDVRILAGDFNATLDHPELRDLLDRGYHDAADAVGAGFTPTWPAPPRSARSLPLTIDHVLVDRRVHVESVTVVDVPHSDHRAVIAVLRLPRS